MTHGNIGYTARNIAFAFILTGLGLLKGIRIVIDSIDDAVTLPRTTL